MSATNLARGKPATQSSTLNGGFASRAVDGILTSDPTRKDAAYGCTATDPKLKIHWWRVDLLGRYAIREIKIFIEGITSMYY